MEWFPKALVAALVICLLVVVFILANTVRIQADPSAYMYSDSSKLATQIERVDRDVLILQTQVAGLKQQ